METIQRWLQQHSNDTPATDNDWERIQLLKIDIECIEVDRLLMLARVKNTHTHNNVSAPDKTQQNSKNGCWLIIIDAKVRRTDENGASRMNETKTRK